MILSCNSCGKKFVVPDKAIPAAGRMVQCGSCGNKWKQFPIKNEINKINQLLVFKNNFKTSSNSTKRSNLKKLKRKR